MKAKNAFLILFACEISAVFTSDSKIEWISVHQSKVPLALQSPDGIEGQISTYVCRIIHGTGKYSGKLVYDPPYTPKCIYGIDGKQKSNENFEILSAPKGSLSWQQHDGRISENAIAGGYAHWVPHETNYVCRGWIDNTNTTLVIGYYTTSNVCYASYNNELQLRSFEVLVKNNYGTLLSY